MTPQKELIDFDTFLKADIRVGVVEKAEPHPNADKLLVLQVNFGDLGMRQICAGIREFTDGQWMVGSRFLFVVNLATRKMRGVDSQGMILAASNEDHSRLTIPEAGHSCMIKEDRPITSDEVLIPAGSSVG